MTITMEDLEKINFPYYYNLVKEGKMKAGEVVELLFNGKRGKYKRYRRIMEGKPTRTEAERRRDKKWEEKEKRNKGKSPEQIKAEWKQKLNHMSNDEANQFFIKNMIRIKKGDTVLIRRCYKCMEYKKVEEFSKSKNQEGGIRPICKECEGKRYENNKEYILNQQKERREANPDYMKEYYEANRDRWKERYESKVQQALEDIRLIVESNPTKYDYIPGMEIYGIIYLVYNRITKRYYVGQTTISFDIRYRDGFFKYHIDKKEDRDRQPNELLKQDLELYGEDSFEFNKIFKVASNQYELDKIEAYWIDKLEAYTKGYNRTRGNWFTNRGLEDIEG